MTEMKGLKAIGTSSINMVPAIGPAVSTVRYTAAAATEGTIFQPVVSGWTPQASTREIGAHDGPLCPLFRNATETYDFARDSGFIDKK